MSQGWDPLGEIQRQVTRILRTIDTASGRTFRAFPPLNLHDSGDAFVLEVEVPGTVAEEIEVSVAGETLVLRGERKRPDEVPDEAYRRQERPFGRWSRSVTLPERIAIDAATAECVDGRLVVTLPKHDDRQPRRIAVATNPRPV